MGELTIFLLESIAGFIPSFDLLVQVGNGAVALDAPIEIEPASLVGSLYGLARNLGFMLPSTCYVIHRYPENFERADQLANKAIG